MSSIEYLEEERKKLWEKVLQLEQDVKKKTPDYEKEAKVASKKTSEYRNRSNEANKIAQKNVVQIDDYLNKSASIVDSIKDYNLSIEKLYQNAEIDTKKISEYVELINSRKVILDEQISTLEGYFEDEKIYSENITTLGSYFENGKNLNSKIDLLYKSVLNRKKDIDELYREIYGYEENQLDDEENETEVHVDGLRDVLEHSYKNIKNNLKEFENEISETKKQTLNDYELFVERKDREFKETHKKWKDGYEASLNKINELLPNALTTGLSYAYSEKKKSEENESKILTKNFKTATYGLVAVSLIPFAISIVSLFDNKTLEEVIMNMPRLVLSILPLYIPVLWLAYSSNKKLNLSKRLIEEYTHKEVLSKTYEGLSTQIENLNDVNVSSDLKSKLLYNILTVSSENPGKLISDYNKSDHPLMDALDKSVKLANAVDKLSEVPGLSSISKVLNKKSKKIIEKENEKIEKGLEQVTEEEEAEKE